MSSKNVIIGITTPWVTGLMGLACFCTFWDNTKNLHPYCTSIFELLNLMACLTLIQGLLSLLVFQIESLHLNIWLLVDTDVFQLDQGTVHHSWLNAGLEFLQCWYNVQQSRTSNSKKHWWVGTLKAVPSKWNCPVVCLVYSQEDIVNSESVFYGGLL